MRNLPLSLSLSANKISSGSLQDDLNVTISMRLRVVNQFRCGASVSTKPRASQLPKVERLKAQLAESRADLCSKAAERGHVMWTSCLICSQEHAFEQLATSRSEAPHRLSRMSESSEQAHPKTKPRRTLKLLLRLPRLPCPKKAKKVGPPSVISRG